MVDKAPITPKVLRWARESARMSEGDAASKVNVSVDRLRDWEQGNDMPTMKQAEKLAHSYKRSFALFFLPDVPKDFEPLKDFRRKNAIPLGTASVFIIREIQQKQGWIREVFEDAEEDTLHFVGQFKVGRHEPKMVAENMLETLGISSPSYGNADPMQVWVRAAEANGIFVSRTSFIHSRMTLNSDELQGFAIADSYAPFVFVNSDDWNAAQLFTLVHELAHIWVGETGISNEIEVAGESDKIDAVELFCNEVAANALMPAAYVRAILDEDIISGKGVYRVAKSFGVSSFALLVRMKRLNLIDKKRYTLLKLECDKAFALFEEQEDAKKAKQKETPGGPSPYMLRTLRHGKLFTQIVIDAFRSGSIPPTQACGLLGTQVDMFPKLEKYLYA